MVGKKRKFPAGGKITTTKTIHKTVGTVTSILTIIIL